MMMRKDYTQPTTTVLALGVLRDVCGITAASDGDDSGGLAKKDFGEWEEDEETVAAKHNTVWDD